MIDPKRLPKCVEARDYLGRVRTYNRPEWPTSFDLWSFIRATFLAPLVVSLLCITIISMPALEFASWVPRTLPRVTGWLDFAFQWLVMGVALTGVVYALVWAVWRLAMLRYISRVVESQRRQL